MKKLLLLLLMILGPALAASAQSDTCTDGQALVMDTINKRYKCIDRTGLPSGTSLTMTVANEGVTGTTVNRFVKLTGAPSTAIIATTADVDNVIGVCVSGCGITGNATVAIIGQVSIDFDAATTAGNYVTVSVTTNGKAHDAGSTFPAGSTAYGRVLSTNGASGTFVMELMTPDLAASAGVSANGKNRPPGTSPNLVYNNANAWAGASLFQKDANTVEQRNGTTIQTFDVYRTFTDASNYERLAVSSDATNFNVTMEKAGTGANRGLTFTAGGSATLTLDSANGFYPSSAISLGLSTKPWGDVQSNGGTGYVVRAANAGIKWNTPGGFIRDVGNSGVGGVFSLESASSNGATIATGSRTAAQITADQNDYNPGGVALLQRWSSDASRTVTGLNPQPAGTIDDGEQHLIVNVGTNNIVLSNENAASSAANRFHNSTGADITLSADQAALCVYDSTTLRWRVSPAIGPVTGTGSVVLATSPTFTTSAISPLFRSTSAKVLIQGTGTGATQLSATQTTAPTCTTNCGTSPSVVGTDSAGIVTMGATGSPASGWVVTFNGTWAAAPACLVTSALAGMVVGKMPIVVATTTTTFTVTTNGTAPANSDKYAFQCMGTQ